MSFRRRSTGVPKIYHRMKGNLQTLVRSPIHEAMIGNVTSSKFNSELLGRWHNPFQSHHVQPIRVWSFEDYFPGIILTDRELAWNPLSDPRLSADFTHSLTLCDCSRRRFTVLRKVNLQSLTVDDCDCRDRSGAVFVDSISIRATITYCTFLNYRAREQGGALFIDSFSLRATITVVHLIAGRYLIAGTPPNLTQVKIREYLKMETLIEHE
jgi:hypothetical protein